MDIFTIVILGGCHGIGGGTLRDIILDVIRSTGSPI
ncbi:MAG: TRIC cation channel family protein [Desulfoprunum sp.]|nr:TRIC cation channel family protein [Desulfoprunum sp.]